MTFQLNVHFLDDSADFYEYSARVQTERFSGYTDGAEVFGKDLREFAARLRDFPLSNDRPPSLTTGSNWDGLPYEECMRIEITPFDSTGTLLARISLTDVSEGKPHQRVNMNSASFHTDYAMLERFAESIERILRDGHGEALLDKMK